MKKFIFLLLVVLIACNKDDDNNGDNSVISKVEYRIWTSTDGAGVKYLDASGKEVFAIMSDSAEWVMSFTPKKQPDSVGFKIKDYLTWVTYKIVINTDTVINYTGTVPEGDENRWYGVYYHTN